MRGAVSIVALLIAGLPATPARAGECALNSPDHRVTVLELYTSEGCNSCPPADRWFSGLRRTGIGPDAAVLLAFHVDYWNQLGWPDPFSQPAFSARQRQAAARASWGIVYTPQVLLNGVDYRQAGDRGGLRERLADLNRQAPGARIRASVHHEADRLRVAGEVTSPARGLHLWIATFENGLYTQVRAGENAGKRLDHDFVVRDLIGPVPFDEHGRARLDHQVALRAGSRTERLGVAVFVERADSGGVLQAASLYPVCP
jgi:hypothetical protein